MEEVCTCKGCGSQSWLISKERMYCTKCKKTYKFFEDTLAVSLVNLTNDNF